MDIVSLYAEHYDRNHLEEISVQDYLLRLQR